MRKTVLLLLLSCTVAACGDDDPLAAYSGLILTTNSTYQPGDQYYGKTVAFTNLDDFVTWFGYVSQENPDPSNQEFLDWFASASGESMMFIPSGTSVRVEEVIREGAIVVAQVTDKNGAFSGDPVYILSMYVNGPSGEPVMHETMPL